MLFSCQELPAFPVTEDLPSPTGDGSLDGSSDAALPSPVPGDRSPPSWNPAPGDAESVASFEPPSIEADLPDPKRELSFDPPSIVRRKHGDESPLSIDVDSEAEALKEAKALQEGEDSGAETLKEGAAFKVPKFPAPEGEDESLALVLASDAGNHEPASESEDSEKTRVLGSHLVGDDSSSEAAVEDTKLQKFREKTLARAKRISNGHPSHARVCGFRVEGLLRVGW